MFVARAAITRRHLQSANPPAPPPSGSLYPPRNKLATTTQRRSCCDLPGGVCASVWRIYKGLCMYVAMCVCVFKLQSISHRLMVTLGHLRSPPFLHHVRDACMRWCACAAGPVSLLHPCLQARYSGRGVQYLSRAVGPVRVVRVRARECMGFECCFVWRPGAIVRGARLNDSSETKKKSRARRAQRVERV